MVTGKRTNNYLQTLHRTLRLSSTTSTKNETIIKKKEEEQTNK
jgi:hypothetical protein